ncbi:transporter substrate-binding domain-containing protein [Anaeromyxobacter paludicola]|uniref:histidine kinase n=1 Tax=Anaeromyxobacter paludicola TaxID=2918171 RepID=A0ABM7XFQ0_9BACT|nr:transporter substrate-binding domain-containing protein [Anaeromyxobacter paludicola]BDG10731.1 histidine kinase [Anaeromyxobacter paludicola]
MTRRLLSLLALTVLALAPGAAAAAADLSQRVLRVGGDRDYPPYEFLDADGKPAGYNVDLTRAIAEVMGLRVEFELGAWSAARQSLREGRIDLLQGMSWSEARAREFDLSPPHTVISHAIFARRDGRAALSLEELRGRSVAVHRDGIMDETLTGMGLGQELRRTDTPADALRLVAAGKADFAVVAELPGIWLTRALKLDNVVPVAHDVASQRYGYAARHGDAELMARVVEGLAIVKKTGRYDAIRQKWLGVLEQGRPSWAEYARYGAVLLLPVVVVLGGTVVWTRSLQHEVAQRTALLAREVAERQQAVEQLRLNQAQLVQADKMAALGVLVSGVAHEINNPNGYLLLNLPVLKDVVLDAVEPLEERYRAEGDFRVGGLRWSRLREELPEMLGEMIEGSRRIKRIVEDLKDFARQEDAPRLAPLELNGVVAAALRLVGNSIKGATRHFEVSYADGLPRVRGNAQRLEQVVVNLVLNACQSLPDPGRAVRVSTRHDPRERAVLLVVEDEGVGIPPEHLSRLTDPFFTTKRESGGTGLGLSVSSGIVTEHGGTLRFSSREGAGTTAVVSLPVAAEEGAA